MVNYNGSTVTYDRRGRIYSRPPVKVVRVCKNGFKRPLGDDTCPCYKCGEV